MNLNGNGVKLNEDRMLLIWPAAAARSDAPCSLCRLPLVLSAVAAAVINVTLDAKGVMGG